MKKFFAWLLFLTTTLACIASSAWYFLGYGLFTPHSNIVYTGLVLFNWKLLLISSYLSLGALLVHGYLVGRTLWYNDISRAIKISLISLTSLALLFLINRMY